MVLPLTLVRWLEFKRQWDGAPNNVPGAVTFTFVSIFSLSGFANVLLFAYTRPDLLLFQRDPPPRTHQGEPPSQGADMPSEPHNQDAENVGTLPPPDAGGWDLPADNHEPENT
jgi:hypothetical protein